MFVFYSVKILMEFIDNTNFVDYKICLIDGFSW